MGNLEARGIVTNLPFKRSLRQQSGDTQRTPPEPGEPGGFYGDPNWREWRVGQGEGDRYRT